MQAVQPWHTSMCARSSLHWDHQAVPVPPPVSNRLGSSQSRRFHPSFTSFSPIMSLSTSSNKPPSYTDTMPPPAIIPSEALVMLLPQPPGDHLQFMQTFFAFSSGFQRSQGSYAEMGMFGRLLDGVPRLHQSPLHWDFVPLDSLPAGSPPHEPQAAWLGASMTERTFVCLRADLNPCPLHLQIAPSPEQSLVPSAASLCPAATRPALQPTIV